MRRLPPESYLTRTRFPYLTLLLVNLEIACRAIEVQAVASADIKVIGHSQIDTIDRLARSVLQIVGDNGRDRHRLNIASSIVIDNRKRRGGGQDLIPRRIERHVIGVDRRSEERRVGKKG